MFNLNSENMFEDEVLNETQQIVINNTGGTIIIQNVEKKKEDDLEDELNDTPQESPEPVEEVIPEELPISPDDNPYEDEVGKIDAGMIDTPVEETPVDSTYENEPPLKKIISKKKDPESVKSTEILPAESVPYEDDLENSLIDPGMIEEPSVEDIPEETPTVSDIIPDDLEISQEEIPTNTYEDEEIIPEEVKENIPGMEEELPVEDQFYEDQPTEELSPVDEEIPPGDPNVIPEDPNTIPPIDPNTPIDPNMENPYFEDEAAQVEDQSSLVDPGMQEPIGIDAASGMPVVDPNELAATNTAIGVAAGEPLGTPTTITPPVKSDDLNRLYELKGIHEKLISVKKILNNESHPFFDKLKDKVLDAYEYFSTVIKNLDGYTDTIDDIIIKYKNFIFLVLQETDKYKKIFDKENEDKSKKSNKDDKKKDDETSLNTSYKDKDNFYEDEKPKQETKSKPKLKKKKKKGKK